MQNTLPGAQDNASHAFCFAYTCASHPNEVVWTPIHARMSNARLCVINAQIGSHALCQVAVAAIDGRNLCSYTVYPCAKIDAMGTQRNHSNLLNVEPVRACENDHPCHSVATPSLNFTVRVA
eukprot:2188025-Amphidinium_carterae.1